MIFDHASLSVDSCHEVHGGDINRAYCVVSGHQRHFLKINDAGRYPGLFNKEAGGLEALSAELSTPEQLIAIPAVIKFGTAGNWQYLLLDWLEKGQPSVGFWEQFGRSLALLHQKNQPFFGWHEDNYIGSLIQKNDRAASWPRFYGEQRILPLVSALVDRGVFSVRDQAAAESLCKKLNSLFPDEPPSLLHGDLWAGNHMPLCSGKPAIFDPAVYFGHREMDIAMSRLFGGFDEAFYSAYNSVYPLQNGWLKRLPLTQLYPLLVHAVLFGGHYVSGARNIIRQLS